MPSIAVKLYSPYFKFMLKHRLQSRLQALENDANFSGVISRPEEETLVAANPSFSDGVATKDIRVDPVTSLSIRVFLPETCLQSSGKMKISRSESAIHRLDQNQALTRHCSYGSLTNDVVSGSGDDVAATRAQGTDTINSYGSCVDDVNLKTENSGYNPLGNNLRKLPVMLQFHGGGFVSGSNDSVANDSFCRRIAKLCDVIVLAVGYRLAPESKFPAAFEDGLNVLHWLAKQTNLKESGANSLKNSDTNCDVADAFGASMVEPWLAAHANPSRCVLLGVSCGGNIADYVARKAMDAGKGLEPIQVVAQVLMYPFFIGSTPTESEIRLANAYFYDIATCMLLWKLFSPKEDLTQDHPAANPLAPGREGPPLKKMPPTLTVVAEHDWMRDRAIAYSTELRKVKVHAPVMEYKDAVHEFATLNILLSTPQAQACAEDIAIWVKKFISNPGHEFSY